MIDTLIVIPCYNEAKRLQSADILDFLDKHPQFQCLFVNDGSSDATADLLSMMQEVNPSQCSILNLPNNVGKAEAVRQGILCGLEKQPRYIGFWDADLATPLQSATRFRMVLEKHSRPHIVLGTRLRLCGQMVRRSSKRALLGRFFSSAASAVLGTTVRDTQCGAKLFRCSPAIGSIFNKPFCGKWAFDVEVFLRWRQLSRTAPSAFAPLREVLWELPLEAWRDVPGSKLTSLEMLRAGMELANLLYRYRLSSRGGSDCEAPTVRTQRKLLFEEDAPQNLPFRLRIFDGQPKLPVMSSLWIGPLAPLERACIESFMRNGHAYHLYVYQTPSDVPPGVTVRDAREILPEDHIFRNIRGAGTGSYACFADLFRYKLLRDRGGFWVDTDVFCLRPFAFHEPYVFGAEDKPVANGVIKAPVGSELMQRVYAESSQVNHDRVIWNELGDIFSKHVISLGLARYIQPSKVFSPTPYYDIPAIVGSNHSIQIPSESHGMHLYQETWRRNGLDKHDIDGPNSLLRLLLEIGQPTTAYNPPTTTYNKAA